ncbi:glutathione peroxidase [Pararhodobacter zhoushanensis]|uniref:glutathione peroxidase n=1 Tax=Pararhodobacter zhoushanensis TaxID=2479545 RepID=UPI000F8E3E2A|nr:glutathione peroxidase [Pararhodobacter zhoushanensis]
MRFLVSFFLLVLALPAQAFTFTAIDGATYDLDDWRGQPVLVVNTASLCGFTPQYADLQALFETYAPRGLVVLAVPSDDFRQELDDDHAVEQYCRIELGVDVPLTRITPVTGPEAHPFYRWLAQEHGVEPTWNFNKALIGPDGSLLGFWGSTTRPTSDRITRLIEANLPD